MGDIGTTPWLISEIEAALAYFGMMGEVTVTTAYVSLGVIEYNITVENTQANLVVLKNDGCVIGELVLQGCCTKATSGVTGPDPTDPDPTNPTNPDNYDLFYQKLTYDGLDVQEIEYSSDCRTGLMLDVFTHDKNHRVTLRDNTIFNPQRQDDWYSTTNTYDLAGNILTMTRNGLYTNQNGNAYGLIDDLAYTYNPDTKNLMSIADQAPDPDAQPRGMAAPLTGYAYDGNGNMLNSYGGLVTWNPINMPLSAFGAGGETKFDYSFGGEKIRVQEQAGDKEDRVYLAGAEFVYDYEENEYGRDNYQFSEGRRQYRKLAYGEVPLDPEPSTLQYQITDHLGNLAVLFSDANADGHIYSEEEAPTGEEIEVLQRHFYYPYGLDMEGTWTQVPQYKDRYQYNHKELVKGLGWHAYGFRYYDAVIGRFAGVDPIADKFAWVATYNYAEDSPIGNVDLHGLQSLDANGKWQDNMMGGSYTHIEGDIYLYSRLEGNVTNHWLNVGDNGKWELMKSDYSHRQTGTGMGLSVDKTSPSYQVGLSKYTKPLGAMSAYGIGGALGAAFSAFAIPALGESGVLSSPFSVNSLPLGGFSAANGLSSQLMQNDYDLGKVNFTNVLADGVLKNPVTSNIAGNTVKLNMSDGFSIGIPDFNETYSGILGDYMGGGISKYAGQGSDLSTKYVSAMYGSMLGKVSAQGIKKSTEDEN